MHQFEDVVAQTTVAWGDEKRGLRICSRCQFRDVVIPDGEK